MQTGRILYLCSSVKSFYWIFLLSLFSLSVHSWLWWVMSKLTKITNCISVAEEFLQEKSTRFWRFCKAQDSHLNLFCWSMYSALTCCLKRSGVDGCSLCLENNWANQSLFIGIKNGDIISPRAGARNRVNEILYGHKKDEQTSMKLKKWRLL